MPRPRPRACAIVVLAGACAAAGWVPSAGQDTQAARPKAAAPADAPVVAPVRLSVVVTDRRGQPVVDLAPGDFELRENGTAQRLAKVEFRDGRKVAPETLPADASPEEEERLAERAGIRVFAFVLDEFHVTPGPPSERVRDSLARFVDERLRPGDLAAVLKPLDSLPAVRFSRRREPIRQAIAAFEGRKGDLTASTTFEQQFIGRAPETVQAARAQIITAAVRELALRLGDLRADRAAIVLVSEGFTRPATIARSVRLPDIQELVRACSRVNVPVYSFSPAPPPEPDTAEARAAGTLKSLSTQTGGEAFSGLDGLDAALRRMDDDLATYYALTYEPTKADGRFHPLEVRTTRAEAVVRTRPGYWAPLPPLLRAVTSAYPLIGRRELKRSPLITAWTGTSRDDDGRLRLVVTWEPRAPGRPAAVLVTARTAAGVPLYEGKIVRVGDHGAGTAGDSARFEVPAGRVELDLSVLSLSGTVLDVDKRDVDVPDLGSRKGPVLFTPHVVRGRTLPEFRAQSANPLAAPSPLRAFARSDRLLVRASAWGPGEETVEVTAQLLNAVNRPMRPLDRTAAQPGPFVQFDLPLSWLAPGEYVIEVRARSQSGNARDVTRFTVR